eukprot:6819824-Pyramimonas_sp.AAC.1
MHSRNLLPLGIERAQPPLRSATLSGRKLFRLRGARRQHEHAPVVFEWECGSSTDGSAGRVAI